ncbi:MAG: histidine kinase dimerization/phospho-acceptor domain-containing protein [Vicinamibacterales bacterium]
MIAGLRTLRSRIFLASTLLATASIGSAVYVVSTLLTAQAETELQRDLTEAVTLVDQQNATRLETVSRTAGLIADLPKLKAALETQDPPTVAPIARDYLEQAGADVVVVTDRDGRRLAMATAGHGESAEAAPAVTVPSAVQPGASFWPHPDGVLQLVTVPVIIGPDPPERLGLLTMGFLLDRPRAEELRRLTGAEIAFVLTGAVRATSLPPVSVPAVAAWFGAPARPGVLRLGDDDFSLLASPLAGPDAAASVVPHAIVLRSRTERMQTLDTIRATLMAVALATVGLAALLAWSLARTVTRPLAAITDHMREAAATGELARKIELADSAWTDEDARLVAATYNTLTDSVVAAQRDAAQRERLSALGRLSTVIAHEIRNPLMIIKGALRQLERSGGSPEDARDAAADIDGEVGRLNRVVNEVLDFARPIRFDCAPADANDLCRSAREAVVAAAPRPDISLDLDPAAGLVDTDGERVRTVLVNLLTNARAAVEAARPTARPRPSRSPLAARKPGGADGPRSR